MSYQERRSIVNVVSTLLIVAVYSLYMFQRYPEGDAYSVEVFRFWGTFMLVLIPVSIIAKIGVYIVFTIINTVATREMEPLVTDERDKLIELKANRNSQYTFATGFMLAMASLVVDQPPSVMFGILLCSGVIAEVVNHTSQFYYYRRGV